MEKMKQILLILICSLILPSYAMAETEIIISRSDHSLIVLRNDIVMKRFHVAFGSGGRFGKVKQGDRKTPYGKYKVMLIKGSERFHSFIQLDYPNVNDAEQGYFNDILTREEYRSIIDAHWEGKMPPQNTPLGGAIGLHGIGKETEERIDIHEHFDWTKGCLALRNHELDLLTAFIRKGTTVLITP